MSNYKFSLLVEDAEDNEIIRTEVFSLESLLGEIGKIDRYIKKIEGQREFEQEMAIERDQENLLEV